MIAACDGSTQRSDYLLANYHPVISTSILENEETNTSISVSVLPATLTIDGTEYTVTSGAEGTTTDSTSVPALLTLNNISYGACTSTDTSVSTSPLPASLSVDNSVFTSTIGGTTSSTLPKALTINGIVYTAGCTP